MKPRGRSPKEWTDRQLQAVSEYLNTKDKSYKDIAEKYGVPVTTLKYWVAKYRKQEKESDNT